MTVAAVVFLAACGGDDDADVLPPVDSTSGSDAPAEEPAADSGEVPAGSWRAAEGVVDGSEVTLIPGYDVTIEIAGGEIRGTAACNGFGGAVEIDADGTFAVRDLAITEMGCVDDGVMELEQTFVGSLLQFDTWSLDGERLVLSSGASAWTFVRPEPTPTADLVGTVWVLDTYLSGDAATNASGMESATLTLNADGSLVGSTGCRELAGAWQEEGAAIVVTAFEAFGDPAVDCLADAEQIDRWVVNVLGDRFTAAIDGDRLTLTAPGGDGLSYRAADPDAAPPTTTLPSESAPPESAERSAVEIRPVIACGDDLTLIDSYIVLLDPASGQECSLGPPAIEGPAFARDAAAVLDDLGNWTVLVSLADASIDAWNGAARACVEQTETCPTGRLAIVAAGEIVSAPVVQSPSFPEEILITGNFTQAEAEELAAAINTTS